MNIISIIPARGGSKSIPGKNIYPVCGKPLIAWTIEQSLKTDLINMTFVTTDSDEIAMVSEDYGAKIIRRPDTISGDTATSEAALLHALENVRTVFNFDPDLIVFLQATSPLRKKDDITNCILKITESGSDSLFSGCRLEDFLIWQNNGGKWESLNYDYRNRGMRQQREAQYVENGSIYVFKPSILERFNNRIGGNVAFYEMDFWQTWEIDNPEDIEIVEAFLDKKIKKEDSKQLSLKNIELIVYDFDGVMTDNMVIVDEVGKESVTVNRSDGLAVGYLKEKGYKQIILSTEKNKVVQKRAEKLQINYFYGVDNKKNFLLNFLKSEKISPESVMYVGNDLNDLEIMKSVGFPVCPYDAADEIKQISKYILEKNGGEGVIRCLYNLFKD